MLYFRYDYENCDAEASNKMMETLEQKFAQSGFVGQVFQKDGKTFQLIKADNFEYTDPIDKSVSKKQVWFLAFLFGFFEDQNE